MKALYDYYWTIVYDGIFYRQLQIVQQIRLKDELAKRELKTTNVDFHGATTHEFITQHTYISSPALNY